MVLFHLLLLPLNALITYASFLRSKYNYAEIGVLHLYTISFSVTTFCIHNFI